MSNIVQGQQGAAQSNGSTLNNELRRDSFVICESTPDGDIVTLEKNADDDYESFKNRLRESWDESTAKETKPASRHKQNLSLQFLDISLSEPEKQAADSREGNDLCQGSVGENDDADAITAKEFSPPRPTSSRQHYSEGGSQSSRNQSEAAPSSSDFDYSAGFVVPQIQVTGPISRKHRRGTSGRSNPALAHRRIDSTGYAEPTKGHRRETSEGFEVIDENFVPPGNTPTPPSPGAEAMPPPVPPQYQGQQYPYYYQNSSSGYYGGHDQNYYNPSPSYYSSSHPNSGAAYGNAPYLHAPPSQYQYPSYSSGGSEYRPESSSSSTHQGYHSSQPFAFGNPSLDYSYKPTYTYKSELKSGGGNGGDATNHHRKQSSLGSFLATTGLFDDGDIGYDSEPDRPLSINHQKTMSSNSFIRSLSDDNFLRHITHSAEEDPESTPSAVPESDFASLKEDDDGNHNARKREYYYPQPPRPVPTHPDTQHQSSYYCAPTAGTWQHGYAHPPPPPPPPSAGMYNTPDLSRGESGSDVGDTPELSKEAAKRLRRKCAIPDCPNRVVQGGLCIGHGAKRKICGHPGCTKNVKKAGLCSTHGPARKRCEAEGCTKVAVQGGRCIAHGAKKKMCSLEECTKQAIMGGMCKKHYDQTHNIVKVRASRKKNGTGGSASSKKSTSTPLDLPPIPDKNLSRENSGHQRGLSIFQDMNTVDTIINNGVASSPSKSFPSPTTSGQSGEPPKGNF